MLDSKAKDWILEIISELPQLWRTITEDLPHLATSLGFQQIEALNSAFKTGQPLEIPFPLRNTLLIPLVVISHLLQYITFLQRTSTGSDDLEELFDKSKHGWETVGFCTGLLSAFAVSSSSEYGEYKRYGAVAVRIGLLIGIVVDAQDAVSEFAQSKSISTAWNSVESYGEMLRILENFPEAYVSVYYDKNRATVTTAISSISRFVQELKTSGIIATEVGLYGRFHAECYREHMEKILRFCDTQAGFQFREGSLIVPTRSNSDGEFVNQRASHRFVLRSILTEPPQWFETFSALRDTLSKDKETLLVSFGTERCAPPSLLRMATPHIVYLADLAPLSMESVPRATHLDSDIAVIGMSCKVAGAQNLEEFWDLLCTAKSQHKEVPKERFGFDTSFRDIDPKRKWFGNFIDDYDMFDHKFFKKSPRESATIDPQQRHILQIAYQAVEQSGYFHSNNPDKNVGCFLGVCAVDYENNIACHAPTAFSATGNLKGFIAGKVSHYFGWTGPGVVIDTACSSSAVAVHQACRAIINGECNAALAGGTHVMSSPLWFQNLAGASFLSTTGQYKPFDAKADGYCRGEAVAAVFLKKLSVAVADGDQIFGVIAATAVQQNQNCTPLFVPNVPSLSDLFRVVTKKASLKPAQISVVEAHGTGTAVGDPAEYDSIRQVLGGSARDTPLALSSVKGLIGHTEASSGIVSIIKILLMIQKRMIPAQASFSSINPAINAMPADNIIIPIHSQIWDTEFRAALINNYGASGSNASVILKQSPYNNVEVPAGKPLQAAAGQKYPFWFCSADDQSLRRYCDAVRKYINRKGHSDNDLSISNISFNVARQSNRLLGCDLMFSVRSTDELDQKLEAFVKCDTSEMSIARPATRPIVLCFGGQVSTSVGLDRDVYQSVTVLRKHLEKVDSAIRSMGVESIFPGIFERTPVNDPVRLQTMLFATQYACARSWMDSGVQPAAVVGHSFGELTALCISGILSLEDTVKLIVDRATVVRDLWGDEKGIMMAVEADSKDVDQLLREASIVCPTENFASIACYNGPKSFTLAGSKVAIDAIAEVVSKTPAYSYMRTKRLNVTNAFHCALVDPLMESLEQGAKGLKFCKPTIPMERATQFPQHDGLKAKFVSEHMRFPVYFSHALQRLSDEFPSCIFLEAGSNSKVTSMASRALSSSNGSRFQALNITGDNAWNNLIDATLSLWKAGVTAHFWTHEASQTQKHVPLLLPPYQFEQARHWIDLKVPPKQGATVIVQKAIPQIERLPDDLLSLV